MPFICIYQLNNGAIQSSDSVIFEHYIDEYWGKYNAEQVKIAKVVFNDMPAFICSNGPGFPSTKGVLKKGDPISSTTVIGYFSADGEDIPYYRPYAIIQIE